MLELKNVSFQAEDGGKEIEILRNINLTLENRFVAVTGPNGSGKSTLAKIVAGILTPTEGQIFLDGVDITDKSITERAQMGIGFAFQQPVRFKGLTVKDAIHCGGQGDGGGGGLLYVVRGGTLRQRLCKPRDQCQPLGRGIEAH